MIHFVCPRCEFRYAVPFGQAGQTVVCSAAGCGCLVQVPYPLPPVPGVLLDPETGAEAADWRLAPPPPPGGWAPDGTPGEEHAPPVMSGERCHDCGRLIPEDQLIRRDVEVSRTSSSFHGTTRHTSASGFGDSSYSGSSAHYGRVTLCLDCDLGRDEAERRQRRAVVTACVLIAAAGLAAAVAAFVADLVSRS